jgi:CRISPR system Cascade subunit CasB
MSDMRLYWERFAEDGKWRGSSRPPGHELAVLRRGFGREPGAVPELWSFYTQLDSAGALTRRLRAEHVALGLYGLHQQGEAQPVHLEKVPFGRAVADLRNSGRHSPEAIDRRFVSAATADSVDEVAVHLRSIIQLLKTLPRIRPIDYTELYWDLVFWQDPNKIGKVRRRWGSAYYLHDLASEEHINSDTKERS